MGREKPPYRDPLGAHIRVYHSLMNSPAWRVLSFSGRSLYFDMRVNLTKYNNGNINATFSELQHRGWQSKTTLHKALRELEALGFIAQTRQGGIACLSRVCSLYRFTDREVFSDDKIGIPKVKATHDYLLFASVRDAEAAAKQARPPQNKRHAPKKTVKVHKPDLRSLEAGPLSIN